MKTIDLSKGQHSLSEVLTLASSEALLIVTESGEDFVLEHADELEREAAALGSSAKFSAFLSERSREAGDIPIGEIRKNRGV